MRIFFRLCIIFLLLFTKIQAQEVLYILNDECIVELYESAYSFFKNTSIEVIRDPQGIRLIFEIQNPTIECERLTDQTCNQIKNIEDFLAKIKNPAIIEVHIEDKNYSQQASFKNWEMSTVIANSLEFAISSPIGALNPSRIHSVGYGEFLPLKNPPNNGGKYSNRVDIMILCNVSGE